MRKTFRKKIEVHAMTAATQILKWTIGGQVSPDLKVRVNAAHHWNPSQIGLRHSQQWSESESGCFRLQFYQNFCTPVILAWVLWFSDRLLLDNMFRIQHQHPKSGQRILGGGRAGWQDNGLLGLGTAAPQQRRATGLLSAKRWTRVPQSLLGSSGTTEWTLLHSRNSSPMTATGLLFGGGRGSRVRDGQ